MFAYRIYRVPGVTSDMKPGYHRSFENQASTVLLSDSILSKAVFGEEALFGLTV